MADKEFSHEQAKRPVPDGTPHTSSTLNRFIPSYFPLVHLAWLALITRSDGWAVGQGRSGGNPSHPHCFCPQLLFVMEQSWIRVLSAPLKPGAC